MHAPLWSVLTLVTELCVTAVVFYVIREGWKTGVFHRLLAFGVLAYEILFNISYMVSRASGHVEDIRKGAESGLETGLAIFHGIFSLVMFVSLVGFFGLAARGYARGENFFLSHRRGTAAFLFAWSVSVLSGILFFSYLYLL